MGLLPERGAGRGVGTCGQLALPVWPALGWLALPVWLALGLAASGLTGFGDREESHGKSQSGWGSLACPWFARQWCRVQGPGCKATPRGPCLGAPQPQGPQLGPVNWAAGPSLAPAAGNGRCENCRAGNYRALLISPEWPQSPRRCQRAHGADSAGGPVRGAAWAADPSLGAGWTQDGACFGAQFADPNPLLRPHLYWERPQCWLSPARLSPWLPGPPRSPVTLFPCHEDSLVGEGNLAPLTQLPGAAIFPPPGT